MTSYDKLLRTGTPEDISNSLFAFLTKRGPGISPVTGTEVNELLAGKTSAEINQAVTLTMRKLLNAAFTNQLARREDLINWTRDFLKKVDANTRDTIGIRERAIADGLKKEDADLIFGASGINTEFFRTRRLLMEAMLIAGSTRDELVNVFGQGATDVFLASFSQSRSKATTPNDEIKS